EEGPGGASAEIPRVAPGAEAGAPAGWRFGERGVARLDGLVLASRHPFGLWIARRRVPLPAELVVYPTPRPAPTRPTTGGGGHEGSSERPGQDGAGDLAGLRAYRPGDRPRAIHWPTSARTGAPVVVVRAPEAAERVVVRVADRRGEAWERELGRAVGQ